MKKKIKIAEIGKYSFEMERIPTNKIDCYCIINF